MPYVTTDGDHWDQIALTVYGSEKHVGWLWENNPDLTGVYRFGTGTEIKTPDLPETGGSSDLPPWRR